MKQSFTGRVFTLPDNVDTDIIIPTQYMALPDICSMKQYAFSPLRPELASTLEKGDILVAGNNFGCGSSREQAPEIIRALGISCIIAGSFARIFYRNAITNGLLVLECPGITSFVREGQQVTVDIEKGTVTTADSKVFTTGKIPPRLLEMIEMGGLVGYYRTINEVT